MKIISGIDTLAKPLLGSVITIGNFDGLHIGHRRLVSDVLASSEKTSLPSLVYTFSPHPAEFFTPTEGHKRLFGVDDLAAELEKLGVEYLVVEPFDTRLSQLSAEKFLLTKVLNPLNPSAIIIGRDFHFGKKREANAEDLSSKCASVGVNVSIIEKIQLNGREVSSSWIREALCSGKLNLAKELLGRDYYIGGSVEHGDQRGRTLGFPTANVSTDRAPFMKTGVYFTKVVLAGKCYPAVTNVGESPTFNRLERRIRVESHILAPVGDIYGQEIQVCFLEGHRDEKKFLNVELLIEQISEDVQVAKNYFARLYEMGSDWARCL